MNNLSTLTIILTVLTASTTALAQTSAAQLKIENNNLVLLGASAFMDYHHAAKRFKTWDMRTVSPRGLNARHQYFFDPQGLLERTEFEFKRVDRIIVKSNMQRQADGTWLDKSYIQNPHNIRFELVQANQMLYQINSDGQIIARQTITGLHTGKPSTAVYNYYHYAQNRLVSALTEEGSADSAQQPYNKFAMQYLYDKDNVFIGSLIEMQSNRPNGEQQINRIHFSIVRNEHKQPVREIIESEDKKIVAGQIIPSASTKVQCVYDKYNEQGDWLEKRCDNGKKIVREISYYQ